MDAQQMSDGLTAAQTVMTVLGSMGAFEAAKWLGEWWQKRRDAKVAANAAEAKADQEQQALDHQQARETRKDRIAEYDAIIAQKDADLARLKADLESYRQYSHDRLDHAQTLINDYQMKQVTDAAHIARFEERLLACEEDRTDLRLRVEALDRWRQEMEEQDD